MEPVQIEAAAKEGGPKRFKILAYSGGKMDVGWGDPICVDLSGMEISDKSRPILKDHDTALVVGHSTAITKTKVLQVEGVFSGAGSAKNDVLASAENGFPWQASIGAKALERTFIEQGVTKTVNGQEIEGPCIIVGRSILKEVSFVALGADDNTSAIAASQKPVSHEENTMDKLEKWLVKAGIDASKLTEAGKAMLKAQFDAEEAAILANAKPAPAPAPAPVAQPTQIQAASDLSKDIMAEFGSTHPDIAAEAIEKNWDLKATRLAVLRASRPQSSAAVHTSKDSEDKESFNKQMEIAACYSVGLGKQVEKTEEPKVVEAAQKRFRNLSLQEMIVAAAVRNGYSGRSSFRGDPEGIFRAAFSDLSLPKIFGNVANKKLLASFMEVEQVWRQIARISSNPDFRPTSNLRMTADFKFERVTNAGEIKHANTPTEVEYTNQVDTYGKMYAITRKDIINDDMNVLSTIPAHIGRGAAMKLNEDFWTLFLNNSAKFTTGNKNYIEGSGTVLGIDSLTQAEQLFLDMVDDGGMPLSIQSNLLLVPTALKTKAQQLMNSTEIRDTTASTKFGTANPHAGKWSIACSAYMSNSKFTGYSSTAWYLIGNNSMIPLIDVAFLNGVETPVIESAEADFSTLGVQMRGYFDYGMAWQDVRGAVKSKGAA